MFKTMEGGKLMLQDKIYSYNQFQIDFHSTPLMFAAKNGKLDIVQFLVIEKKAFLELSHNVGWYESLALFNIFTY